MPGSASPSTRARASPTGRAARSTSARSIMRSATSPISPRSFPKMLEQLKKTGRGAWLDQEMERLADPANYANDPDQAWKRVRIAEPQARSARAAQGARALARARGAGQEPAARPHHQGRDAGRPRRPSRRKKQADLARVRGLSATWAANDIGGRLMARARSGARRCPPTKCRRATIASRAWARKARWSPTCSSCCSRSARAKSTSRRDCSRARDDLEALAAGQRDGLPILEGWRFEQFGRDALDLVEGRLGFAVKNGKLKMTRTEDA